MIAEELRQIDNFVADYAAHDRDRPADISHHIRKVGWLLALPDLAEENRQALLERRDAPKALQPRPTRWPGSTASPM